VEAGMLRVSEGTELALEDIWIGLSMCNPDYGSGLVLRLVT
jgi:hypothetical protein